MSEFKQEHRYYVFKLKNLTLDQIDRLYALEMELGPHNSVGECVVVESDWPNYQDTWDAIQAITEKRYISRGHLRADCAEWRARAIKAEAERDALAAKLAKIDRAWADAGGWPETAEEMDAIDDVISSEPMQCLRDVQAEAGVKGLRRGVALASGGDISLDSILVKIWSDQYAESVRQGGAE